MARKSRKTIEKRMLDKVREYRRNALKSDKSRHGLKSEVGSVQREYVWSENSEKQVVRAATQFAKFLAEHHPELKRAELYEIDRKVMGDYLMQREQKGLSPSTISSDMYALNKIYGAGLRKEEFGLRERRVDEFVNNRGLTERPKEYELLTDKAKRQLDVSRAFGVRRNEYKDFTDKSLYMDKKGDLHLYIGASSKGGKVRTAKCTEEMKKVMMERYGSHVRRIDDVSRMSTNKADWRKEVAGGKPLEKTSFDHDLPIHRLGRQHYAQQLLRELEREGVKFPADFLLSANRLQSGYDRYTTNGREMDRSHAQFVSLQLGHNRLDILKSYIL